MPRFSAIASIVTVLTVYYLSTVAPSAHAAPTSYARRAVHSSRVAESNNQRDLDSMPMVPRHALRSRATSIVTMTAEDEHACRAQGGTPEKQGGQAICSMNPLNDRRTIIHATDSSFESQHYISTAAINSRKLQRRSVQRFLEARNGHGRRSFVDNEELD